MLLDLPTDVQEAVTFLLQPIDICALCCVAKGMQMAMESNDAIWCFAWKSQSRPCGMTPKQLVRLAGVTGCQSCGLKRVSGVQWRFRTRMCRACLQRNTVSAKRLEKQYAIPRECWGGLVHETCNLYAVRDVLPFLTEIHGDVSFEAYDERKSREERELCIRMRADTLKLWTEQAGIAPDSLTLSPTYLHNIALPHRLTRAAFWPLLKKIRAEVRRGEKQTHKTGQW